MIAPFDTHIADGNLLAEIQTEARSEPSLLDAFIVEIKRLNATICDMTSDEIEQLKAEAKERQHALSKAMHHDSLIYIYAYIISLCNGILKDRFASPAPEASAAAA